MQSRNLPPDLLFPFESTGFLSPSVGQNTHVFKVFALSGPAHDTLMTQ